MTVTNDVVARPIGNLGFDYEEAIFEAFDDAFEAASLPTTVESWIMQNSKGHSCIIGDKAGGANYAKLFNLQTGKTYAERYETVQDINTKTGLFNAGSFSYLNISNEVWFFTKIKGEWKSVSLIKNLKTGDYHRIDGDNNPKNIVAERQYNIDFEKFDSIVYIKNFNRSSNQNVKDFRVKEDFKGFEKNLRATYNDKLNQGFKIFFNGRELAPLDVFYKHELEKHVKEVMTFSISLNELLKQNEYFREDIYARYLEVFEKDKSMSDPVKALLNQKMYLKFYSYDTKYFNNRYPEETELDDVITFNLLTSGFWIFRNGRKIGNPANNATMGLSELHPTMNMLRVEVIFNPIFDIYFGIQVNKNRYIISDEIKTCIDLKLKQYMEKYNIKNLKSIFSVDFSGDGDSVEDESEQLGWDFDDEIDDQESPKIDENSQDFKFKHNDTLWIKAQKLCLSERSKAGYVVKDVSKNKLGYDIEAKNEQTGEVQYIEVKELFRDGSSFNITPREYAKLKYYGENYYICLVIIGDASADFIYLKNPAAYLNFKEVVKVVEYICKTYDGEKFSKSFVELDII